MPELPDSQKKISSGYSANLGYFRGGHYLRSLKFWCFTLTLLVTAALALTFEKWGSTSAFSTGPLSQNHSHLADRCDTCHTGSDLKNPATFAGGLEQFTTSISLAAMDEACTKCHPGSTLHAPQMWNVALHNPSQSGFVHASACASCHREHAGPHRMALPSAQTCTDCHGSEPRLQEARADSIPQPPSQTAPIPPGGTTFDIGDGVLVFLPPLAKAKATPAFESFAKGHPSFAYERPDARDPSDLKFNHARHFRSDVPKLKRGKLDCISCHQPWADGAFYQPVRYEEHCRECHSLQIQQTLPDLHIPHGDSEKVRFFLAGLDTSITKSIRASGVTETGDVAERLKQEQEALRKRGLFSAADLEKRVFVEGDPRGLDSERLMRSGKPKFLTECAKCHTGKDAPDGSGPEVLPTQTPKRWLAKGAYNHLPHAQYACTDCHGAALKSKETSDILLPSQQSCVQCHQPFPTDKAGVKFSCDNCHHFHSSVTPPAREASAASPKTSKSSTPVKLQP